MPVYLNILPQFYSNCIEEPVLRMIYSIHKEIEMINLPIKESRKGIAKQNKRNGLSKFCI